MRSRKQLDLTYSSTTTFHYMLNSHVLFIPATEQDKLRSRIYQQNRRNAVKASLIERIEVLVRENFEKLSEDASTPVDVAQIEIAVKDTVTKLTGSKKKRKHAASEDSVIEPND